jgi:hypothetical protein
MVDNASFLLNDTERDFDLSIWGVPEVRNWAINILNGMDEYFWDGAIYYLRKIYWSFTPFMRFVVDMMINKVKPEEIAQMTKKPIQTVYKTIGRAKKRLKNSVLFNFS